MSSNNNGSRRARWSVATFAAGAALVCALAPASAEGPRSSAEDRQRLVSLAHKLEQAPLNPGLQADRQWALAWLTDAPDITVTMCADALGGLLRSKYRYSGEIVFQDMLSTAAFLIEHPESANDPVAQQLAGVEGALNAYRAILRERPDAKSSAMETLLQTRSRGELPAFIAKAWTRCVAKK